MNPLLPTIALATLGVALFEGCSNHSPDDAANSADSATLGGYTGLGQFTAVSGTYGNGAVASGGVTSVAASSSTDPRSSGGAVAGPTTAAGGSTGSSAVVVPGNGGSAIGGSVSGSTPSGSTPASTTAGGSTLRNSTGSGGSSTALGGATGGRNGSASPSVGGTTPSGTSAGGTNAPGGAANRGGATAGGAPVTTTAGFTWPDTYNSTGTASDPTGKHSPGQNCLSSACHASTQTSRAFAFGGTIYQPGGTAAAANVEVAITFGTTTVTTYSASNGNFWLPLASAPAIDWTNATVHLRNGKGELAKAPGTSVAAGCNSCHGSTMRMVGP